ncbi:unnamed protein product, partial [Symbiodinium pilosum]
ADLEELQAIFDKVGAQCHYRTDVPHKSRLGFVAQDFEGAGVTGTARHEDRNLMTLDYARLTAVLGPGMAEKAALNLLRRLASDFNVRDAGKLYQISKREFLDQPAVGEPRNGRLEEGCGKADAGPEAPDLIDFSQTRGDENNYVVTTDEGNEFRVADATEAYNACPHEAVHAAPEDVEAQPTIQFRVLQDNAEKFQHNKALTEGRRTGCSRRTNANRSFQPSYGPARDLADF